jgi:hypothetical protein
MRFLFSLGYFGSWVITAALLLFIPTALLWEMANVSALTGIDDDLTLLSVPLGAVLGAWAAVRSHRASAIHRVFLIVGVCFTLTGLSMAGWFIRRSEQAGGTGPFAGMGELAGAGMSIGIAALGVTMIGIWAFARLAKFGNVDERSDKPTVPFGRG